jgi:hypothetical protein
MQITVDGLAVTPGLQPPGSLAPSDTFLMHGVMLLTSPAQKNAGLQAALLQFNPPGLAQCTAVGGPAFDSLGTITYLCMTRDAFLGPGSATITGAGMQGSTQLFRVVQHTCSEDCTARSTACAPTSVMR